MGSVTGGHIDKALASHPSLSPLKLNPPVPVCIPLVKGHVAGIYLVSKGAQIFCSLLPQPGVKSTPNCQNYKGLEQLLKAPITPWEPCRKSGPSLHAKHGTVYISEDAPPTTRCVSSPRLVPPQCSLAIRLHKTLWNTPDVHSVAASLKSSERLLFVMKAHLLIVQVSLPALSGSCLSWS